jgi:hypothetical protein
MPIFTIIRGGLRALFGKQRAEQELDEELRCYMETAVEQKMRAGTGREEAARETRIEMGGMEALKEQVRERGGPRNSSPHRVGASARRRARLLRPRKTRRPRRPYGRTQVRLTS